MYVFLFTSIFFFPLPLIFTLMESSISHFLTTAICFFLPQKLSPFVIVIVIIIIIIISRSSFFRYKR